MSLKTLLRSAVHYHRLLNYSGIAIQNVGYGHHSQGNNGDLRRGLGKVLAAAVLTSYGFSNTNNDDSKSDEDEENKNESILNNDKIEAGARKPDLPTYGAEEVSKHDTKTDCWVTYKNGVYNVTDFIVSHPGGEQLLMAAGHSVEPFWALYSMHHTSQVYKLLEEHRIGNLSAEDVMESEDATALWAGEPARDPRLLLRTARPFNAEAPPSAQVDHFDTPNELFYVRQHMPVPVLDASAHRVSVRLAGAGARAGARGECSLSLGALAALPQHGVRAALMCAGNRRSEMATRVVDKSVKGIGWSGGAVSNARWRGVLLRDVLEHAGMDVDNVDTEGLHVILVGADIDATGTAFSTSIPLAMALDPARRVMLATSMNGAPLPPDHGYPVRAVVPGAPAVRSVKWLESIIVSKEESSSHWHQKDYRSFNSSDTWETADFSTAPPLYNLPVTSCACDPQDGDTVEVKDGCVRVRGYAYSGGGARIVRVDVSTNGGAYWKSASLQTDDAPAPTHHAWTLWTVDAPVGKGAKEVEIWVKATDSNFNTQPETFDHIWNIRGLLSNAYHRITVNLKHSG